MIIRFFQNFQILFLLILQIQAALSVSIYASPLILAWLYRRDFFTQDGFVYLGKCIAGITLVFYIAFYVRGIGRVFNPQYRQFIEILIKTQSSAPATTESKAMLANYDFSFGAWPTDYQVQSGSGNVSFIMSREQRSTWQKIKDFPKLIGQVQPLRIALRPMGQYLA